MRQVYVHGLGQTSDSWKETIRNMKSGEQSVCPDLTRLVRGQEVNYKNLYRAFSDLCNEIDGMIDLCGLSLGGVMCLNYALDYPKKVHSLVLIAAQYRMPKRLLQFQNILFRFMPKSMFVQTGFGKAEMIMLCKSMMDLDFTSSLRNISCPVLVICGGKDTANRKASVELAATLKHARLHAVEKSGHEINVDAPKELAGMLSDFYNGECKGGNERRLIL